MTTKHPPIACTLTSKDAATQALEWVDLQHKAIDAVALPDGARMRFRAELEPLVADLVEREQQCCAFLDITMRASSDELIVEVRSTNPDALPIIALLAGLSA